MTTSTVRDMRLHLTKYLRLVEAGDEVVIRRRSQPIAKLVPFRAARQEKFPDLTAFREDLGHRWTGKRTGTDEMVRRLRDEGN